MKRVLTQKQLVERIEKDYKKAKIRALLGQETEARAVRLKRFLNFVNRKPGTIERRDFNVHNG